MLLWHVKKQATTKMGTTVCGETPRTACTCTKHFEMHAASAAIAAKFLKTYCTEPERALMR